jgi:hypothetical protein
MNRLRHYLSHPYYWRRAVLRLFEVVTRRMDLETHLDDLLADAFYPAPADNTRPATGLRLLYVAPKFDYGNPARGYSYEENHFLPSLAALGFDVIRFDSLTLVRRLGARPAGDLLVEAAFRLRPQVAFFVLFKDDFLADALDELRRLGCVTFNWFTDDHWRLESFSRHWAPHFSWAITTHADAIARYRALGITNVIRSQWAVNQQLYRPLDRPRRYAATFVGQPHGDRRQVVDALRRAGVDVQTWGYGWPRGKLSTRQVVEVINESAVSLNLSNASVGALDQIKGRDFEVPACRALLVTKHVEALPEYYAVGTEVLTYDTLDDLIRTSRWALDHPSETERVREAGYQRVLRDHTYEQRFKEILRSAGVLA